MVIRSPANCAQADQHWRALRIGLCRTNLQSDLIPRTAASAAAIGVASQYLHPHPRPRGHFSSGGARPLGSGQTASGTIREKGSNFLCNVSKARGKLHKLLPGKGISHTRAESLDAAKYLVFLPKLQIKTAVILPSFRSCSTTLRHRVHSTSMAVLGWPPGRKASALSGAWSPRPPQPRQR